MSKAIGFDQSEILPGSRVASHAATDEFMKGQRFGTVIKLDKETHSDGEGHTWVLVQFDTGKASQRAKWMRAYNLRVIE